MNRFFGGLVVVFALSFVACRDKPKEQIDEIVADVVDEEDGLEPMDIPEQELTGNERWIRPPGTAKITFYVDDRANRTFADGDMTWTGSFAWNADDNTIEWSSGWGPLDGPYPLLYDDGPIAQGGHEMAGAEGGDGIFSTEIYFKAVEDQDFDYGVLNELGFWMWEGSNGQFTVTKGSTATINAQGLELKAFGDIDLKVTVDVGKLNPEYSYVEEWGGVKVYLKGSMNMWAPNQILDMGPEINKGDAVADDGIFTFVQGLNPGEHTGLLLDGQHAQFTFMFGKPDEDHTTAVEYKILSEGKQQGALEGVKAFLSCDDGANWSPAEIVLEPDSWGSTLNSTVIAVCDGEPPVPDCTPEGDECGDGEKCIDGKCLPWCDLDDDCAEGEKCIDNKCKIWCDLDDDCGDGYECKDNKCVEVVVVSEPEVLSIDPDGGPTEGGTLVVVSGSDFQDGATVTFDGTPGTGIVVLSAAGIECNSPAMPAGKVDVTVTNPDGGTDTYISAYNYVEEAQAPAINSIVPVEGPVTGGTEVTISGSNFLPGPTVLFGQTIADWVDFKNSGEVVVGTPAGQLGTVNVKLINTDTQETVLAQAFTYVPNSVDYAILLPPLNLLTLVEQPSEEIFAEVYEPEITQGEGAGQGLQAEFGYGLQTDAVENWTWSAATYHGESGNNDVWKGVLQEAATGNYAFTFRFSMDGTNWAYADSTGSMDGFDVAGTGTWEVVELGDDPAIFSLAPASGTVLGGTTVTVNGANFDAALTLEVDGEAVAPVNVTADAIVFTTAQHAAGPVSVKVQNPEGDPAMKEGGFAYVLKFTPTVDGSLAEWDTLFVGGTNAIESDWGANVLTTLYAAFDANFLYVGVEGFAEEANYILGYVDIDYTQGSGVVDMLDLADNNGNGDLDDALSNVLFVSVADFGADFAFGSQGMTSFVQGDALAGAEFVGWRSLANVGDFDWLDGSVVAGEGSLEAAIPLGTLYGEGVVGNKQVALFVRLANKYGGFDGMSNQTLPEYFNDVVPGEVGALFVFDLTFQ